MNSYMTEWLRRIQATLVEDTLPQNATSEDDPVVYRRIELVVDRIANPYHRTRDYPNPQIEASIGDQN